ncbi:MAG: hypothetical protein N2484_03065 [Clostridia bacterium]|nr:hypothetical protein [Clostridia bacterium]
MERLLATAQKRSVKIMANAVSVLKNMPKTIPCRFVDESPCQN